ncbi:MAG TPA: hypothetical protein VL049_27155, partial [Candidatus Dormibacteraeota bacterium]|nr:hypothetical protein [Candidatus Dormibacteraeota bacterium]
MSTWRTQPAIAARVGEEERHQQMRGAVADAHQRRTGPQRGGAHQHAREEEAGRRVRGYERRAAGADLVQQRERRRRDQHRDDGGGARCEQASAECQRRRQHCEADQHLLDQAGGEPSREAGRGALFGRNE